MSSVWRSPRWLAGVCCGVLLACGSTNSSPPTPEPSAGAAARAGNSSSGGAAGGGGHGLLLGGVAGSLADSDGGELSLGGAEDPGAYHGPVDLCLYDADIPDSWIAAGTVQGSNKECVVGVLGRFAFNRCRYELLDTMPFNVDPFVGNHSSCCYRSKLVGCP